MSISYDLKVNRTLLDYKFDGYKLTLDPLAIHRLSLENAVESPKLPEEFFSYQHLKVFGAVNKLFMDPWFEDSLYYVDIVSGIHCAYLDPTMNCTSVKDQTVAKVSKDAPTQSRVATTLSFPDEQYAVLSNGTSHLVLYETGKRGLTVGTWKVCYEGEPLGTESIFLIQHSSTTPPPPDSSALPLIEVLLIEVCKNDSPTRNASNHVAKLHWLTFQVAPTCILKRHRVVESSSAFDYGVVEGEQLYVASEKPVTFSYDSVNEVVKQTTVPEDSSIEELQTEEAIDKEDALYNWTQKGREVVLYMRLHEHVTSADVTCDISANHLRLSIKDIFLLDGDLCGTVAVNSCTWTLDDKKLLEIYLEKSEEEEWGEVVRGDVRGSRVLDLEQVAAINELLKPFESTDQASSTSVPFNLGQLEECDQLSTEAAALYCFHGHEHQLLQKVNISNHQWLFSSLLAHQTTPYICLRHDVDGLIFQLRRPLEVSKGDLKNGGEGDGKQEDDSLSSWQHTNTLHAFGYLQASKEQKKFIASSADFSFVAIAEERRHVFIYRQPTPISTDLRNRKTSQKVARVAKQHLVSLDCTQSFEGLVATKGRLFILTCHSLYCVQVE